MLLHPHVFRTKVGARLVLTYAGAQVRVYAAMAAAALPEKLLVCLFSPTCRPSYTARGGVGEEENVSAIF